MKSQSKRQERKKSKKKFARCNLVSFYIEKEGKKIIKVNENKHLQEIFFFQITPKANNTIEK